MTVKKSLILFLIFSILGVISIFFYFSEPSSLAVVFSEINVFFLVLCLVGVPLIDWILSGIRMRLFTGAISPDVSFAACVRNCAVGSFMCAVTPSQTGGGAAQIWILTRDGASGGQAIAVVLMTFLSTLVFYILAALGLWIFSDHIPMPTGINKSVFATALILFAATTAALILALMKPDHVLNWLERGAKRFKQKSFLANLFERILNWLRESSACVRQLFGTIKLRFLLSVLFSVAIFGNKYFAAYLSAQALGLSPLLLNIIIIQMFLHILIYFMPTPGGSGGAEIGSVMLMAGLIPETLMTAYTIIWRSAITYLAVLAGGLIFVYYLHRASKKFT